MDNSIAIESTIANALRTSGVPRSIHLSTAVARNASGLPLTDATASSPTAPVLGINAATDPLAWLQSGAETDYASWTFPVPEGWPEDPTKVFAVIQVWAKCVDTATENSDLRLLAKINRVRAGAVTAMATGALSSIVGANVSTGYVSGFVEYTIDVGARVRAEKLTFAPGDAVQVQVGPNETVGTTNMVLAVAQSRLLYKEHLGWSDTLRALLNL
jgi:hypothetical protein